MPTRLSLEPTRRSVMLMAVGCGIGLLACCSVAVYGLSKVGSANSQLELKQAELADGEKIARKLSESETTYFDSLKELHYLEKTMSTRQYIPTMLKQLEGMAKSVNLKVLAVRPIVEPTPPPKPRAAEGADGEEANTAPPPPKPPYDSQKIDITVEGSYSNALSFLYRLTTFPKILTVNSVTINPSPTAKSGSIADMHKLEIKVNVSAYILDEPKSQTEDAEEPSFSQHKEKLSEVGVSGPAKVGD